jgi:hypothetical protein
MKLVADALAWASVLALAAGIAWPYVTGRRREVMKLHFWIGYLLAPVAFAHGWYAMKSGEARGASAFGLTLASVALLPLILQVFVGRSLHRQVADRRRTVRRWHFAVMLAVGVLVGAHLALVRW